MVIQTKNYVALVDQGALRVGESGVSLDSLVFAYEEGLTAEAIQEQYPALSLEDVHGGPAFYLANRDEVGQYLKQQESCWEELRKKIVATTSPVALRLRALRGRSSSDQ